MIVTFYSYKGGVGRSMALANVADLIARSGLRVLMVDFDLEAPGLEHFFPIDHNLVRDREGLLDLLLAFKYSMSVASPGSDDGGAFRQLDRFITTVYPTRSTGGGLDLLPAGQRRTDEQIVRYGVELRRFDWLDFYFTWSGDLFFEWLRRAFAERYDAVLVDSRTGVTEMGGVCAYQLADAIVVLCAPNQQNLAGTDAMVQHFLSRPVRAVRADRPLDVLVVPARVGQEDNVLRQAFQGRFSERFAAYQPAALTAAGLTPWDLLIPYEPRYAFDEQVVTDPERLAERQGLAAAYATLLEAIALIAPDGSALAGLRQLGSGDQGRLVPAPVETRYDPTTRFAAADVFISFAASLGETAAEFERLLTREGLIVASRVREAAATRAYSDLVQTARVGLVLIGPARVLSPDQTWEIQQLLSSERPVIPVILPSADPSLMPPALQVRIYLDFRAGIDSERLLASVRAALVGPTSDRPRTTDLVEQCPYRGLMPFREEDQDVFFGRDAEVREMIRRLERDSSCAIVGSAGSGKTSVVFAGLIPALRRGALSGSERWPVVTVRPGNRPLLSLVEMLTSLVRTERDDAVDLREDPAALATLLHKRFERVVLVVDQLEELFTLAPRSERDRFVDYFTRLREQLEVQLVPILILRAEFNTQVVGVGYLGGVFSSPIVIHPLSREILRVAIEGPARRRGVALEPGLTERLVDDVTGQPGALPLLQAILFELWSDQKDGYLTHWSYERMGGVTSVLAHHGDAAFGQLSPREQDIAQLVMLRLVTITDSEPRRRGPVEMRELTTAVEARGFDSSEVGRVVTRLIDRRLLVATIEKGQPQLELAHEALIQGWPRLRQWIEQATEALRARSRLDAAAAEWERLGRDRAALLSIDRLEQLLSAMPGIPLTALEHAYVAAVREQAETVRARTNRLARRVVGLAAAASAALTSLVFAIESLWSLRPVTVVAGATVVMAVTAVAAAAKFLGTPAMKRRPAPREWASPPTAVDEAIVHLIHTVRLQWQEEADIRQLRDPQPIMVRWTAAEPALMDWPDVVALTTAAGRRSRELRLAGRLDQVVEDFRRLPRRRLVVTGGPGAGKTGVLLLLTLGLLADWQRGEPVPVLLTMSSWNPLRDAFLEWLSSHLADNYSFLRQGAKAKELVAQGCLLPLLDGLDELPAQRRAAALEAVNRVGVQQPLVIACRTHEFAQAVREGDALTGAAVVEMGPVEPEQDIDYLRLTTPRDARSARWEPVFAALRKGGTTPVSAALSTPLMLSLARSVYALDRRADPGELADNRRFPTRDSIEDHLLDALIPIAFGAAGGRSRARSLRWERDHAQRWLAFLALRLHQRNSRELTWYELAPVGPGRLVLGLVSGLFAGLLFALAAAGVAGLVAPGVVGPAAGVAGVMLGLMVGLCIAAGRRFPTYQLARAGLAIRGRLPWQLMAFLQDAHRLGILRRVGAVYQFRYSRLQDRLVQKASESGKLMAGRLRSHAGRKNETGEHEMAVGANGATLDWRDLFGFASVFVGVGSLVLILVILLGYGKSFQEIVAIIGAVASAIVSMVSAYFGISSATKGQAQALTNQKATSDQALANQKATSDQALASLKDASDKLYRAALAVDPGSDLGKQLAASALGGTSAGAA